MKKFNVHFYPVPLKDKDDEESSTPINLSVIFSGLRLIYYTGLRCIPKKQWDKDLSQLNKNQTAPGNFSTREFNDELKRINTAVSDLFKAYDVNNIFPTVKQLRQDIKIKLGKTPKKIEPFTKPSKELGFFQCFDKYIQDAPVVKDRKKHLQTTLNKIRKFRPDTAFSKINVQYIIDFHNYLVDKCGISENTAISELRRFRAFLYYAKNVDWHKMEIPFGAEKFKISQEVFGEPVYNTLQELKLLVKTSFPRPSLERVRDMFVLQSFLGPRVSDFMNLRRPNIIDGCIEYIPSKKKDQDSRTLQVPLNDLALDILNKYGSSH